MSTTETPIPTPAHDLLLSAGPQLEALIEADRERETARLRGLTHDEVLVLAKEQFDFTGRPSKKSLIEDLADVFANDTNAGRDLRTLREADAREAAILRKIENAPAGRAFVVETLANDVALIVEEKPNYGPRSVIETALRLVESSVTAHLWGLVEYNARQYGHSPAEALTFVAQTILQQIVTEASYGSKQSSSQVANMADDAERTARAKWLKDARQYLPAGDLRDAIGF